MQTKNFIISAILTGLFLSFGFEISAQTITKEEVTVIAPYSPTISKAQKLSYFPLIENNLENKLKLEYYTNPKLISTTFALEELKAAQYISPKIPKQKQNVIMAGMGLYTTPYAELFLNGKLNENLQIGLHAKHLSSKATVNNYAFSGFSKNEAQLWGKRIGEKNAFWISGFYQRDAFHYYGFKPEEFLGNYSVSPDFDSITAQVFSEAGLKFNLYNRVNNKKVSFKIDGTYLIFMDKFSNTENQLILNGNYQRPIKLLKLKNEFLGISFNTEISATNWENHTQQTVFEVNKSITIDDMPKHFLNRNAELSLYYKLEYNRFDFKIGGVLSTSNDTASIFKIYPDLALNVNLIKNALDIYGRFDGGLISPSYYSISRENPFVSAYIPLNFTNRAYRFKGGLKANFFGKADLHLWGSTESLKNEMFFTSNTRSVYGNQFNLLFDDAELLRFGGDINIGVKNAIIGLQLVYQEYSMKHEVRAWYKPSWSGQLTADYWLFDNLKLSMALKGQSAVYAKVGTDVYKMGSWFDLELGANYHFNKEFSAFVNLNNLLSPNYQIWYNYPVKGFGAMVGVNYAF